MSLAFHPPAAAAPTLMDRIDRLEVQLAQERRLLEDAVLFRLAFSYGPPCLLSSHAGRIHRVSNALQRLLGYSKDEIKARGWTWLTHPDDLAATAQATAACRARALTTGYEHMTLAVRYRQIQRQWLPVHLQIHVAQVDEFKDLLAVVFVEPREGE